MEKQLPMSTDLIPTNLQDQLVAYRVDQDDAQVLLTEYGAPFTEAGEILTTYETIKVADENDTTTMKLAREQHLKLRKVRIGVENKRKELKADIVKRGNAIDGVARFVKEVIAPAEEYLQLQEDFAIIKAAERKAARLATRTEALHPYPVSTTHYDLDGMSDEDFNALVVTLENERQERVAAQAKAKADAEARAEAERQERERIQAENTRLRIEAEERRKAETVEREKREALERAERERLAREEAERQKVLEQARQAELAPDKEKLTNFSRALEVIRAEKLPVVASPAAQAIVVTINEMLTQIQRVIVEESERL